eukprot:755208-Hanusia_phi.AAC.3
MRRWVVAYRQWWVQGVVQADCTGVVELSDGCPVGLERVFRNGGWGYLNSGPGWVRKKGNQLKRGGGVKEKGVGHPESSQKSRWGWAEDGVQNIESTGGVSGT